MSFSMLTPMLREWALRLVRWRLVDEDQDGDSYPRVSVILDNDKCP
jgi:hypothetical protein